MTEPSDTQQAKRLFNPIEQLNTEVDSYLQDQMKSILSTGQSEANQAPMTQQEVEGVKKFIIANDHHDAAEQRMAMMGEARSTITRLEIELKAYVDERILKSPRSVFTGPKFPWHLTWVADSDKKRGMRELTEADSQYKELLLFEGYRPADFRKLQHLFVTGRDAALLAVNRTGHVIQALAAKKVLPPPPLPPHLFDKFGTVLPPVISPDGSFWVGAMRLYMIERVLMDEKRLEFRRLSNGDLHAQNPEGGIVRESGAMQGRSEIDLDSMMGGNIRR